MGAVARAAAVALAAAALAFGPAHARAGAAPSVPAAPSATPAPASAFPSAGACAALARADLSNVQDAPAHVISTREIAASPEAPAHCLVTGYVAPAVAFDVRLPQAWNGKFLAMGCGGYCGARFPLATCAPALKRGYACAVSDMGHQSTALDAAWGYDNLQAKFDFGVRATHVQTLAGKAVARLFYGRDPERTYYMGCSTGGRQGMFAAQRFPTDFDGVVAGAAVISETGDGTTLLWNALAVRDGQGRPLFTQANLEALHAAVVAACDLNDGVRDGLIGDGGRCRFDPAAMARCPPGSEVAACFTPVQVAAVRKLYAGPTDSRGRPIGFSRVLPGSELNWWNTYVSPEPARNAVYYDFISDLFRYLAFVPDAGPAWRAETFDWDRDPERADAMEVLYNAQNPDLRRFKAHGGKLIAYHGWADQSVMPQFSTDYSETATRTMGGPAATRDFYRLFMVPGMNHCSGGEGAWRIDYLGYLEKWVEQGQAPDMMLAEHPSVPREALAPYGADRLPPSMVAFTRPVFPYPAEARYAGKGDPADAANWVALAPRP